MFARVDIKNGIFVYSASNGLIYAIAYEALDSNQQKLLENNDTDAIAKIVDAYTFKTERLLPAEGYWALPDLIKYPLTINWLITNKCTQKCSYCYADDVINQNDSIENMDYKSVAQNILKLNPLNVVLSGGEPFSNPDISDIVKILSGKTGIIIDTNGINCDAVIELAPLLAEHNVVIRISIDTFILKNEQKLRPSYAKKDIYSDFNGIIDTIETLGKYNIIYSIQTVLTKLNANDLYSMGDRLYKMGIPVWKIIPVQEAAGKEASVREIKLSDKKAEYFIEKLKAKAETHWIGMDIANTSVKRVLNDVVLVLPDGFFYTEGGYKTGKKLIDHNSPHDPSMNEIIKKVDLREHFRRYLNAKI